MDENFAPYAPTKAVMAVINRYRDHGLPWPLDTEAIQKVGVAGTMAPRTLQALKFLKLIKDDGSATETFNRLKRASFDEYPALLAEVVRAAYLPVFTIVNPADATDIAISDAFRGYEPSKQRDKMISLFRGLCGEVGIIPAKTRQRSGGRKPRPEGTARTAKQPKQGANDPGTPPLPPPLDGENLDLGLISAVVQRLPRKPRWTATQRERWLQAMTSAVDLVLDVSDEGGEQ